MVYYISFFANAPTKGQSISKNNLSVVRSRMKLMSPKNLVFTALLPLFIFSLVFAGNASAQSKKKADAKKAVAKKADLKKKERAAKDARNDKAKANSRSKVTAKTDAKKDTKKDKIAAKDIGRAHV